MADAMAGHVDVTDDVMRGVEALLMAAGTPLSVERLTVLLDRYAPADPAAVRAALRILAARYAQTAVDLVEVAGGWRFQVGAEHAQLVARLWQERPPKLSRALLETLALICYRQPLARSDIEQVRGVSVSSSIIKTLQEYGWIRVVAHRDVPGRPALFGTTRQFLDDFGIKRLDNLPALPELQDLDALEAAVARVQPADGGASAAAITSETAGTASVQTATTQTQQAPGADSSKVKSSE